MNGSGSVSAMEQHHEQLVHINVSGTRYTVHQRTLEADSQIHVKFKADGIWLPGREEWYFERDPLVFRFVHSYLRHGELHLPQNLCGPYLEKELNAWGIQMGLDLQRCCFGEVMATKQRLSSLENFEKTFHEDLSGGHRLIHNEKWLLFSKAMWKLLDKPSSSWWATCYSVVQALVVVLSVFFFIIESHSLFRRKITKEELVEFYNLTQRNLTQIRNKFEKPVDWLDTGDAICSAFLTLDVLLRALFCPVLLLFCTSVYTAIDILSLLPFYFVHIYTLNHESAWFSFTDTPRIIDYVSFMKVLIVLRLFRILKRYRSTQVLLYTLRVSTADLFLMLILFIVGTLFFGTLIYFAEDSLTSIPIGLWWSLVTMTTVGYGDVVPSSTAGYFLGCLCALTGIILVALIVPILVNNFNMYYTHAQVLDRMQNFLKRAKWKRTTRLFSNDKCVTVAQL